jgi:hypothetical protein
MTSFVFQQPGSAKLLDAINLAADGAEAGGGVFAFASTSGVEALFRVPALTRMLGASNQFHLVVGVDAITNAEALLCIADKRAKYRGALSSEVSKFWTHGKDGRSSTSMLQLIRSIGTPDSRVANVIGFADVVQSVDQIHLFDELAARRIADLCRPGDKKCRTVVLVGNAHSSLNGSSSIPSKLEKLGNQTYVVNFVHDGGAAWVCISGRCGATPIANPPRDGACKTERIIYQDRRVAGVDAEFCLPTVTPSPPAKSNGSGSNLPQAKEYPPRPL